MKSVVFTYGRFNPPHKGHRKMINKIISQAKTNNKTPMVIVSHSTGNAKNPLTVNNKIKILKNWYPNLEIMSSAKNRPLAKIVENFSPNSQMVVGHNRRTQFKFLPIAPPIVLNRTNNAPSATRARAAAMNGNANTFRNLTGYNLTNNIINKVKTAATAKTPARARTAAKPKTITKPKTPAKPKTVKIGLSKTNSVKK